MSDSDGKKTLGLRSGARSGQVKQSFSHGRTKNVVVETKRKRVVVPKPGASSKPSGGGSGGGDPSKRPGGLSEAELERRMRALAAAKAREGEEALKREAEEKSREEERQRRREEIEAKEREEREREEAQKAKVEEEAAAKRADEEAAKNAAADAAKPAEPASKAPAGADGASAGRPRPTNRHPPRNLAKPSANAKIADAARARQMMVVAALAS